MRNSYYMNIEDYLDSTYLKTAEQAMISEEENRNNIKGLINEAIKHNFKLVMIRPMYITLAKELIKKSKSNVLVGTVVDFPLGDSPTEDKIKEAKDVIELGVDDVDYVADYNIFKQKRFDKFDLDILEGTRLGVIHNKTVKWIIETGALSVEEIKSITKRISQIVSKEFSDYVEKVFIKTSTGYYGGFGATIKDVKVMRSVSGDLPIKASGGVSNFSDFSQMIAAGATRIGTSKALKIFKKE